MPENSKVVIAMPIHGHVSPLVLGSLIQVVMEATSAGILERAIVAQGSLIADARNQLVVEAFQMVPDMTHLMWIDSDMVLPSDTIVRLVGHDRQVVGGLYCSKTDPHPLIAYELDGEFRPLAEVPDAPRRVGALGLGCTLVRADVLRDMALTYQDAAWHQLRDDDGEDIFFFQRCHEMGVEVWLDPSIVCGHVRDQAIRPG